MKKSALLLALMLGVFSFSCSDNSDDTPECSGDNCKQECSGDNCKQECTGDNCKQECTGDNCKQECTGDNCKQECTGDNCKQECTGDNCKQPPQPGDSIHIRFATANVTCDKESYDCPSSQNILRSLNADIIMLQEFKVFSQTFDSFVSTIFGKDFNYYRGSVTERYTNGDLDSAAKPNGIISRYPFAEDEDGSPLVGEWRPVYEKFVTGEATEVYAYDDRQWTWAVIDIPGDKDLLVISVHLHTDNHAKEYTPLAKRIALKLEEKDYYVAIGGDFNTKETPNPRKTVIDHEGLMNIFYANDKDSEWPVDQNNNQATNKKRAMPLDWLLFSHDLEEFEVPTEIGTHTGEAAYPHGHVFDTRVYDKVGELYFIQPADGSYTVDAKDSDATNMQHMAVIRDIAIPVQK